MTFRDSFEATVDRSTNLSDVEKFNYLLSYLQKDALHTVSISHANKKCKLQVALELLRNDSGIGIKSYWRV